MARLCPRDPSAPAVPRRRGLRPLHRVPSPCPPGIRLSALGICSHVQPLPLGSVWKFRAIDRLHAPLERPICHVSQSPLRIHGALLRWTVSGIPATFAPASPAGRRVCLFESRRRGAGKESRRLSLVG